MKNKRTLQVMVVAVLGYAAIALFTEVNPAFNFCYLLLVALTLLGIKIYETHE